MLAISVILKNLPKVNSHPMDQNSPNPVTLKLLQFMLSAQATLFSEKNHSSSQ
jgi:hypothetical protein